VISKKRMMMKHLTHNQKRMMHNQNKLMYSQRHLKEMLKTHMKIFTRITITGKMRNQILIQKKWIFTMNKFRA